MVPTPELWIFLALLAPFKFGAIAGSASNENSGAKSYPPLTPITAHLWSVLEHKSVLLDTVRKVNVSLECESAIELFIHGLNNHSLWAFESE